MKATGVAIDKLDQKGVEYKLIKEYVDNTQVERQNKQVKNIFTLQKDSEKKNYREDLDNKVLLFHGSKLSNIMGIMAQGLRA